MSDESTPGRDGAVSVRITRAGWRAHIPTALIIAAVTALQGGACSTQTVKLDELMRDVHELNTRVSRIEGALGVRTASLGSEGAGGTGAAAD